MDRCDLSKIAKPVSRWSGSVAQTFVGSVCDQGQLVEDQQGSLGSESSEVVPPSKFNEIICRNPLQTRGAGTYKAGRQADYKILETSNC